MRRIFRQCGSTALQIKSFAIRYHFLFADALLQARQNFCQRKEVKAMNRELSDIIAMVEAGQFDLILQAAQKIEDARSRSYAFAGVAAVMAKAGQKERANQVFQLALQAAQEIEDAWARSWALERIAVAMAKAGQFDLALQTAQKIEDAKVRSRALRGIAEAMAEAEQLDRALQVAQKIEDAWLRSLALSDIAEAMAEAGQLDLALQVAQKIEDARSRSYGASWRSPLRWQKRGKWSGLIKSSNRPSSRPGN
jgi:tetratricopeptide (TPR) repeat protein